MELNQERMMVVLSSLASGEVTERNVNSLLPAQRLFFFVQFVFDRVDQRLRRMLQSLGVPNGRLNGGPEVRDGRRCDTSNLHGGSSTNVPVA